jgi:hypothetical protein
VIIESINQTNKLQALSLISDVYKYQLELATNSDILADALRLSSQAHSHIESWEMVNEKMAQSQPTEEGKTTNGVF